jgi:thiamine-monophosphate kinase
MLLTGDVLENLRVERLVGGFPRSPLQRNGLGESDAELVRIPGTSLLLAISTDSIVEEFETGLYQDPYLIGWMTIVASSSDLAAVGADPIGILLNETLVAGGDEDCEQRLQQGVRDACDACGLYLLGGDTNISDRLHMGATAVGTVPDGEAMQRTGCRPGDHLFVTGALGLGNAFAFDRLSGNPGDTRLPYLPVSRLREGKLLRGFASACMDSSDGAVATLDELMRCSGFGLQLERSSDDILHPEARALAHTTGIPSWLFLAGPHGEYELIFSVPPGNVSAFLTTASDEGLATLELGLARAEPGLQLSREDGGAWLEAAGMRNLSSEAGLDVQQHVARLLELAIPMA